ncbi:MAG: phage holin family protein [Atopobiaceae bacterium]|nr:phage holin family protein [Atopobiaceae bacterium]
MEFLLTWLTTTIATAIAIAIVPGIQAVGGSYAGPAMCALALALVNAFVKPLVRVLSLPINIVTLGLFYLVIDAFMLQLAGTLSVDLFGSGIAIDSFWSAFFGSIIISLASSFIGSIIGGSE